MTRISCTSFGIRPYLPLLRYVDLNGSFLGLGGRGRRIDRGGVTDSRSRIDGDGELPCRSNTDPPSLLCLTKSFESGTPADCRVPIQKSEMVSGCRFVLRQRVLFSLTEVLCQI